MLTHFSLVWLFAIPWTVASVHDIFPARIIEWVVMPSSGDLSNPRIECNSPASPALQVDSLTAEPLGKSNYMYKKFILRSMCKN